MMPVCEPARENLKGKQPQRRLRRNKQGCFEAGSRLPGAKHTGIVCTNRAKWNPLFKSLQDIRTHGPFDGALDVRLADAKRPFPAGDQDNGGLDIILITVQHVGHILG